MAVGLGAGPPYPPPLADCCGNPIRENHIKITQFPDVSWDWKNHISDTFTRRLPLLARSTYLLAILGLAILVNGWGSKICLAIANSNQTFLCVLCYTHTRMPSQLTDARPLRTSSSTPTQFEMAPIIVITLGREGRRQSNKTTNTHQYKVENDMEVKNKHCSS